MKKVDKKLKELTRLALDNGIELRETIVNISGKEYYVTFSYRLIGDTCAMCGQPIKEE